jgi:signal transduction histidine kinase
MIGRRVEMTATRADGIEFPCELAISRIPLDGPPSFTGYLRDITERKQSEEELRRSGAYLAEAQKLSMTGSFGWNVSADEHFWSDETFRIFEYEVSTKVTLQLILDRVHPQDVPLVRRVIALAADGKDIDYECRLLMPSGAVKHLRIVAHGTRDQAGHLEYIGAVQDVTKRRLSEEALGEVRSELAHVARVASLGALTASIAHEVSQPLSGIITNASTCLRMLAADPPNVEGARETARRTIRDGNRASDVITRLRALFSKKVPTNEPVDLNEATHEVIALLRSELQRSRVILRAELDDEIPPVTGDRVQLQQVILNLLRNASEAMSSIDDRPRQLVIRTEREEDDSARLSVQDAGVGFKPQDEDRLFGSFYTTKSDGMGMGLSVSRSIIESHHGRLWATLNDGPGATFSFSIPQRPESARYAGNLGTIWTPGVTDTQHVMRNP